MTLVFHDTGVHRWWGRSRLVEDGRVPSRSVLNWLVTCRSNRCVASTCPVYLVAYGNYNTDL